MVDLKLHLLSGKSNSELLELNIDEKANLTALLKGKLPVMSTVIKKNSRIQQKAQAVIENNISQLLKKLNQMHIEGSPNLIIDFKSYISKF